MSFNLKFALLSVFVAFSPAVYSQEEDDDQQWLMQSESNASNHQENKGSMAYKQEDQESPKEAKLAKKRKADSDEELREQIKRTRSSIMLSREKIPKSEPQELQKFSTDAKWKTCFTPKEHCLESIIDLIEGSTRSVYIQAYILSSQEIADSLVSAHKKGVEVKVLIDKQQLFVEWSKISFLISNEVPVYTDILATLAHNKVIVIDKKIVVTGSYNFSHAAESRNAENIIVIHDPKVAESYLNGFIDRYQDCYRYEKNAGAANLYSSPSRRETLSRLKRPLTPKSKRTLKPKSRQDLKPAVRELYL